MAVSTQALSTQALSTQALSTQALSTQALSTQALSTQALGFYLLFGFGFGAYTKEGQSLGFWCSPPDMIVPMTSSCVMPG